MDESWDQIGKRLRAARDKAELSVDDVVFRARIPRNVIDALEADDFSFFTSPTYAKSFLRQYSEFLKVDAEPWLDALEPASYIGGEAWQPMLATGPAPTSAYQKRPSSHEPRKQEKSESASSGGNLSTVWLTCFSALLLFGIFKGYEILDKKLGQGDEKKPAHQATAPSPTPAAPVVKKPEPVVPPAPAPAEHPVSVATPAPSPTTAPPVAIPVAEPVQAPAPAPVMPEAAPPQTATPVQTPRAIIVRD